MNDLIKDLIEKAKAEGAEIHVVKTGSEPIKDEFEKAKEEAKEIAKLNKILFDAHICAGFTSEEALEIVVATIGVK